MNASAATCDQTAPLPIVLSNEIAAPRARTAATAIPWASGRRRASHAATNPPSSAKTMPKAMLPIMMGTGAAWCGGCPEIWKNANADSAKMRYPTMTAMTDLATLRSRRLIWCLTNKLTGDRRRTECPPVGVRVEREVRPHEWKIASAKGARHITPTRHKAMPVSLARPGVAKRAPPENQLPFWRSPRHIATILSGQIALVSPNNNGKGATMAYNTSSIAFMRPNEPR